MFSLKETDIDKRSEGIKIFLAYTCIDAIVLAGDIEALKYILDYIPYKFYNYQPIKSENHKIEVISFLYENLDNKNIWDKYIFHMCSTNNLEVVQYLIERLDFYERQYMYYMYNAILSKQSRVYSYLYNFYENKYNNASSNEYREPALIMRLVLEPFIQESNINILEWLCEHKFKFCPNRLLGYASSINHGMNHYFLTTGHNKTSGHEEMCHYLYSIYAKECPIHLNKCGFLRSDFAGRWVYNHGFDREKYTESGVPRDEYWRDFYKLN